MLVLPYIEQTAGYAQWDISQQYYNQNTTAQQLGVKTYLCPSRGRSPGTLSTSGDNPDNGSPSTNHYPGSLGDYAASTGSQGSYSGVSPTWYDSKHANGAIIGSNLTGGSGGANFQSPVKLITITDGTSNTSMLGEKHVPKANLGLGGGSGDGSIFNGDHEWHYARIAGPGYSLGNGPNDTTGGGTRFGSWHTGVCIFVFADGSVRAVQNSTDTTVLGNMSNRADGNSVTLE